MRRKWELALLALGSLRRTPLRVALTALGIAIATGALMSMVGFALGVQARVEEPFQKLELLNRIEVTPKKAEPRAPKGTEAEKPPAPVHLDDEAIARIEALPGVKLVYPDFRLSNVPVLHGEHHAKATVISLPRAAGAMPLVKSVLLAGRPFGPAPAREALLGRRLTRSLGFSSPEEALGQALTLEVKGLAPGANGQFTFKEATVEVTVAGVWDPAGGQHGVTSDVLVLPTDVIKDLPGAHFQSALEQLIQGKPDPRLGYGKVIVRMARPSDLFAVNQQLQQMGYATHTLLGQLQEMRTAFLIMDMILTAVGTVALVVAGLGIVNTLLMAVLERYREIGVYKALGASDGDVRWLFLVEAGLVGLLGGLGGLLLGWVVSMLIEVVVNRIAVRQGIHEQVMAFAFPLQLLGGALLFAIVISVVSGVYPATRAARVDPIRALRSE